MEPQNILSPEGKAEEKNTINVAGNGEPVAKTDELPVPEAVESVAETSVADTQVQNPCTREQIVERIKELLAIPVEEVKDEIDALKQQYYKLRKNETTLFKLFFDRKNLVQVLFLGHAIIEGSGNVCFILGHTRASLGLKANPPAWNKQADRCPNVSPQI